MSEVGDDLKVTAELHRTLRNQAMRRAGAEYRDALRRLDLRKLCLPLAVAAVGPQPNSMTADEVAERIEAVSDRLCGYLAKDREMEDALATPEVKP